MRYLRNMKLNTNRLDLITTEAIAEKNKAFSSKSIFVLSFLQSSNNIYAVEYENYLACDSPVGLFELFLNWLRFRFKKTNLVFTSDNFFYCSINHSFLEKLAHNFC